MKHNCQAMAENKPPFEGNYFECGRPAKAWVKDQLNRTGWGGRQYLCGIHTRAHDIVATRLKRPLACPVPATDGKTGEGVNSIPLEWTQNGFIVGPDGTEYTVQREQTYGAQAGGLIYYAMARPPGQVKLESIRTLPPRDRESRVRKQIERIIRAQLCEKGSQ